MTVIREIMKEIPESLGEPSCTMDPLDDITQWLNEGSIVRLYHEQEKYEKLTRVFHQHCEEEKNATGRVIWVDFRDHVKLLRDKEAPESLPNLLKKKGYALCVCPNAKCIGNGDIQSIYTYRRKYDAGRLCPLFPRFRKVLNIRLNSLVS